AAGAARRRAHPPGPLPRAGPARGGRPAAPLPPGLGPEAPPVAARAALDPARHRLGRRLLRAAAGRRGPLRPAAGGARPGQRRTTGVAAGRRRVGPNGRRRAGAAVPPARGAAGPQVGQRLGLHLGSVRVAVGAVAGLAVAVAAPDAPLQWLL